MSYIYSNVLKQLTELFNLESADKLKLNVCVMKDINLYLFIENNWRVQNNTVTSNNWWKMWLRI